MFIIKNVLMIAPFFLKVILENNLNTDAMMIQMKSILQTFRNNSLAIGYDGRNCDAYGEENGPVYQWSLPGALMFSVTVITTIGKLTSVIWFLNYHHQEQHQHCCIKYVQ